MSYIASVFLSFRKNLIWFCLAVVLAGPSIYAVEAVNYGRVTFHFDNPAYIAGVDSTLVRTRGQLQNLLGDSLNFTFDIYLVESAARFDSLVGGRFPEWGGAAAIPVWQRIVVKAPYRFPVNRPLGQLVAHEYAHLALSARVARQPIPRWFDEGVAQMVSMEWRWENTLRIGLATITGEFIPLRDIEGVNRFTSGQAQLAYAESYLAVQYLYREYGHAAVGTFLDSLAVAASVDHALLSATGSNYADFEQEFRIYLQERFNLITVLANMTYLWIGLAIVVIIGAVLRLRKRRDYFRKWEKDEELASTDFDYGDPDHPERPDDDEPWRQ